MERIQQAGRFLNQLNNDIYLAKEDLKFWMFALAFAMDGKLSKGEQNLIKDHNAVTVLFDHLLVAGPPAFLPAFLINYYLKNTY